MKKITCPCGKIWIVWDYSIRQYCSKLCSEKYKKNRKGVAMIKSPCVFCGTEITYYPSQQKKYCSNSCRLKQRLEGDRFIPTIDKEKLKDDKTK